MDLRALVLFAALEASYSASLMLHVGEGRDCGVKVILVSWFWSSIVIVLNPHLRQAAKASTCPDWNGSFPTLAAV